MGLYERNARSSQYNRTNGSSNTPINEDDAPISELLRRFGQDASALVKHEIALAKLELRESVKAYTQDATKLGVAAGVGLLGALALTAFLIVGIGDIIDNYWVSALIVAVAFLATAAVLARRALAHMKRHSLTPERTVQTLKEDQRWAKHEAQDFKRKLKA